MLPARRTVEVLAFCSWSACRISSRSSALRRDRVDLVRLARHREEHVEQVRAVVEVVLRVDERLAEHVLVGGRRDRRHLGDDAVREDLAMPRIIDVERVVVEAGHRGDHRRHLRHRVRVVVEAVVEAQQRLVDHRVPRDAALELRELRPRRQLAVDQQVRDLDERALGGELLDRVAAVQQHALVAVDVGDLRLAGRGRHEAGIEGEDPVILGQRRDVERRPEPTVGDSASSALVLPVDTSVSVNFLVVIGAPPLVRGACHAAAQESRQRRRRTRSAARAANQQIRVSRRTVTAPS